MRGTCTWKLLVSMVVPSILLLGETPPFCHLMFILLDFQDVATEIGTLSQQLAAGDFSKLKDARATVLGLKAPPALVSSILFGCYNYTASNLIACSHLCYSFIVERSFPPCS